MGFPRARLLLGLIWSAFLVSGAVAQQLTPSSASTQCIDCHGKNSPEVVADWKASKHYEAKVGCTDCHGTDHTSVNDVANVKIARPEVCAHCHRSQVDQYRHGKHSHALAAMKTQPNGHWRGMAETWGQAGCAQCHRVGSPNTSNEVNLERFGGIESGALQWGAGACDSCHSRHRFSVTEAREPQACQNCHTGPDHDQWEMYTSSRHGVLYDLQQRKLRPGGALAPTCQTCHMPNGDHEVHTAWGYWGLSLPLPEDQRWAADRTEILKALNVLTADGRISSVADTLKLNDVMRFTQADWQRERDKMIKTCAQCHSQDYARQQLQRGDDVIRNADHLLAEGIRVLSGLYRDGVLVQEGRSYPWLTRFDDPPTVIEQKLDRMYLEHRMRAFQGTFHGSPAYGVQMGLSGMQRELVEIKELAAELRRDTPSAARPSVPATQPPKRKSKTATQ